MLLFSPNTLLSRLLSKNFKIKIYKAIILPVVLYGCGTWSPTLGEEYGNTKQDPEGYICAQEG